MGENYNKIRYPLKFDETLQKLKDISNYKKENNLEKPLIKIQGVWPAIREYPEEFYNTFLPVTDLIAFNPLIDYLHDNEIVYEDSLYALNITKELLVQRTRIMLVVMTLWILK